MQENTGPDSYHTAPADGNMVPLTTVLVATSGYIREDPLHAAWQVGQLKVILMLLQGAGSDKMLLCCLCIAGQRHH